MMSHAALTAGRKFNIGRWQRFAKSGFARDPMAQWAAQAAILLGK